jgi:XisH protein
MSRRDDFHYPVRRALEQEGWVITHDPEILQYGYVIIETDNTEGLTPVLIEVGIRAEDIISGRDADHLEAVPLAA